MFAFIRRRKKRIKNEIDPDEIFLDSSNLPEYNTNQFEGRMERPLGRSAVLSLGGIFLIILAVFGGQSWIIQIRDGAAYGEESDENHLRHTPIIAKRGLIKDRRGENLAWNEITAEEKEVRSYAKEPGLSNLLGYVSAPAKDSSGLYYQDSFVGKSGAEEAFDDILNGDNGLKITEYNALDEIKSESVIRQSESGEAVELSIDKRVQSKLYAEMESLAREVGFKGGAGVIMDVKTGELLAMASFPEYDSEILSRGEDGRRIETYLNDEARPFLNRPVSGLYAPGSILKLFVAAGALSENIIDPEKEILSTGSISVPNPFFPDKQNVFKDWKAHGLVDMRRALAVSSNVYFYEVGGGFEGQQGLGISRLEKYFRMFGFGRETDAGFSGGEAGTVPNPKWKEENFDGEIWRIGDTYNTSIGQYGFQATPLQVARAVSAIGNGGYLVEPMALKGGVSGKAEKLPISDESLMVVREGMRLATLSGTGKALLFSDLKVASKTGTAELGESKQNVNSWVVGFFPYENPRYAFAVVMEEGPAKNLVGSAFVFRRVLEWMAANTPEYLK